RLDAASEKSVLLFTKSSGFEHAVVKRVDGKPSIMDDAVTELGNKHGFKIGVTKDGRIFDSKELHSYAALVFFTTGDLTTPGTDGKPPMSPKGKEALLDAVRNGMGFVGVHAASDTFHTPPDTPDLHVSLTLDTHGMKGECYQRAPYPATWARMHGKGRVFYTAMGDRPENWKNEFFLNLLAGGIRWSIGDASAQVKVNLKEAAPGYAEIPPKYPPAK